MNIVSASVFHAFCVAMVLGACSFFFILDVTRLYRALRSPRSLEVSDRIFGAIVGMACATVGLIGLYLHGWS